VTVTPGSTAPVLSVTVPVMRPRISWAADVTDANEKPTRNPKAAKLRARATADPPWWDDRMTPGERGDLSTSASRGQSVSESVRTKKAGIRFPDAGSNREIASC
jgi:hypothetical protein